MSLSVACENRNRVEVYMSSTASSFCPYKGLQPYTGEDRAYFFGRQRDQEIISANLYAAPLTILYGASGVGKSSVLLAGVVPQLRQAPRIATVVFREWQDASFLSALKACVLREASRSAGKEIDVDASLPFDDFLVETTRAFRGTIFFIFDQFEEYFLYHSEKTSGEEFDTQFARAVNRKEITANFLVSMREDGLSKLDRFQGRIPNLLSNMLRLEHLDRESAIQAIRKPLDEYNRGRGEDQKVTIEDELVEALLKDLSETAQGQTSAATAARYEPRIETPLLQIMLTRLWNEEMEAGSRVLRVSTLTRLGRAEQIIRTHLDRVIEKLNESEGDAAARLFRHLVTPSGAKIALMPSDLAFFAKLPEEQIKQTLMKLSSAEVRILRPVAPPPDKPSTLRYEIFHDVLAEAILDWCTRYETAQQRAQAEKALEQERRRSSRLRKGVAGLVVLVLVAAVATVIAVVQRERAKRANVIAGERLRELIKKDEQAERLTQVLTHLSSKDPEQIKEATEELKQLAAENAFPKELLNAVGDIIILKGSDASPAAQQAALEASTALEQVIAASPEAQKYVDTDQSDDNIPTTVYIHFQDVYQRDTAEYLRKNLQGFGFYVPGVEKVNRSSSQNLLKYFRLSDSDRAAETIKGLSKLGVNAKIQLTLGYNSVARPRTVELWLAAPKVETAQVSEAESAKPEQTTKPDDASKKVKQDGGSSKRKSTDKPKPKG